MVLNEICSTDPLVLVPLSMYSPMRNTSSIRKNTPEITSRTRVCAPNPIARPKSRVGGGLYAAEGRQFRFSRSIEIGVGRHDDPACPAAGAPPADTRMRNIVGSADLEHRHPDTSNRGQAAIVGHR